MPSDRLGPQQFRALFVLSLVARADPPPTAQSIARSVLWSSTTTHDHRDPTVGEVKAMQGVLARLARRGLVERLDVRYRGFGCWAITTAGRARMRHAEPHSGT